MRSKCFNIHNLKKALIAAVALILAAAAVFTAFAAPIEDVAEAAATYISEVQIFSGDSLNNAIKKCEDSGFVAVKKNLNHAQEGDIKDNGIYVIGYKTTHNPDESITGISMLQMNAGYQDYTYGDVAERVVEKLGNIPTELGYAVNEFAENYSNGSPAARAAVKALNCYYIDEMNNRLLGDYMVSGECTPEFIKKLFVRSSTAVVSAVCNALVAGVADYGGDNWAERISKSEIPEMLENDANYKRLDNMYKPIALELVESLQAFSQSYHDVKDRYDANNRKVEVPKGDGTDETEIPEDIAEDMINGGEIQVEDGDAFYIIAYGILNQYSFNGTPFGDYIVSLGDSSYDENADLRKLYPLVDSLTDGQAALMRLNGVACCAIYLKNDTAIIEKAEEQLDEIHSDIISKTGNSSMSIWTGTDQTIYNQKVAITTDADRANAAGQIYNTLTTPNQVDSFLSESMSKLQIIMTVVGIGYSITTIAGTIIGSFSAFAIGSVGASMSVWAVCCAGIGAGVFSTIFGVLGCLFIILNYVCLAAMILIIIGLIVKFFWDLFHEKDEEEFSPIPPVMFDQADHRYVKYEVVCESGSPANINGANARRWNALYYTKSSYVGKPITSTELEDLIVVQYNDASAPTGYTPVKCFGEVTAANLNANSKSDSASVFMFLKTTPGEKYEETDGGEGSEGSAIVSGSYISKLTLSVEESETAAKAALTKAGLHVLDINLTPVEATTKQYSYLGFATTTNPDDAVTDIRIAPRTSSGVYYFGSASYTACGTLPTGDTLYYTSYKSAGSPILADIRVVNSYDEAPEGFEPVNMFCGGNAFNFNTGSEVTNKIQMKSNAQAYEHWNDRKMLLYFKPSVMYTDGPEYISGIVLVAGSKQHNSADDLINECGLRKFDQNLTYGWKAELIKNVNGIDFTNTISGIDTYICYTTTHNPYRAIYGIRSYTAAPDNYNLSPFMGSSATGFYSVCDVLFELPYVSSSSMEDYYRGIYESHSYQFAPFSGEKTNICQQNAIVRLLPEDYETVDWSSSSGRGKGLYVLGPVKDATPLKIDDVIVTSDADTPTGFVSVQDFKTPNRTEPHNLGYMAAEERYKAAPSQPVYIYQRRSAPVEQKYISSISVSSFTYEAATGRSESAFDSSAKKSILVSADDFCIQNLVTSCTDEIIQANIALDRSKTRYASGSNTSSSTSYIGVSRTSTESKAITGIIRYKTTKTDVSPTISVGGVTYTKAGDMIRDPQGSYYLYYTTSTAANPGMPLTSISVSADVFEADCATAMTTMETDVTEIKVGNEVTREGSKATLFGDPTPSSFLHMAYTDTATMIDAIYVGHGKTKKEAQCNLLSLGCNMCIDMDLSKGTKGEFIYIGYTKYTLLRTEKKTGVPTHAVRDIILTVGEEHVKSFTLNGAEYRSAIDEYTIVKGNDGSQAVSLNTGTGGKKIFLYYTTDKIAGATEPIGRLGVSSKDYSMFDSDTKNWEYIFDKNGSRVNVNEGAISTKDDGKHIVDNRIYLYASRNNGDVKSGAAVDPKFVNNGFASFDVYMRGY